VSLNGAHLPAHILSAVVIVVVVILIGFTGGLVSGLGSWDSHLDHVYVIHLTVTDMVMSSGMVVVGSTEQGCHDHVGTKHFSLPGCGGNTFTIIITGSHVVGYIHRWGGDHGDLAVATDGLALGYLSWLAILDAHVTEEARCRTESFTTAGSPVNGFIEFTLPGVANLLIWNMDADLVLHAHLLLPLRKNGSMRIVGGVVMQSGDQHQKR